MEATHRYDDIIEMEYPPKTQDRTRHPRMDMGDRAKIFSPFAALRGHEEMIADRAQSVAEQQDFEVVAYDEST